jgi:methyl coenzyme M reductase subunit C-like uncharacterized protein (methanogenesis marker protein 7)
MVGLTFSSAPLSKMRNVCAHTGRHHIPPSGSDLFEYVEKFKALAECIDMLIGVRLEQFQKTTV